MDILWVVELWRLGWNQTCIQMQLWDVLMCFGLDQTIWALRPGLFFKNIIRTLTTRSQFG